MSAAPTIIDPFSKIEDEVAGESADQVAINFARSLQLSRAWRLPMLRRAPDLATIFKGLTLSTEARSALRSATRLLKPERARS